MNKINYHYTSNNPHILSCFFFNYYIGPNNLDETLQTSNDLIKDLNNMSSFDTDIFGCHNDDIRGTVGTFDSFDLDSLQMLNDIETNHQ